MIGLAFWHLNSTGAVETLTARSVRLNFEENRKQKHRKHVVKVKQFSVKRQQQHNRPNFLNWWGRFIQKWEKKQHYTHKDNTVTNIHSLVNQLFLYLKKNYLCHLAVTLCSLVVNTDWSQIWSKNWFKELIIHRSLSPSMADHWFEARFPIECFQVEKQISTSSSVAEKSKIYRYQ